MMADDDSTPMSRTELAMLWDLLGTWLDSHGQGPQPTPFLAARRIRTAVDAELTERFGG